MPIIGQTGATGVTATQPVTDNAITRWDGNDGRKIQNSPGTLVQDGGAIQAQGFLTNRVIDELVTIPTNYTMVAANVDIEDGEIVIEEDSELLLL